MGVDALLMMPVLPFTILAGIMTGYWLIVMLGMLDIDVLSMDADGDTLPGIFGTIPLTLIGYVGMILSYIAGSLVPGADGILSLPVSIGIALISFIVSVFMSARLFKLMRPMFRANKADSAYEYVDQLATVRSFNKETKFGTATLDGNKKTIIKFTSESDVDTGNTVLLIDYDVVNLRYNAINAS